MMKSANLEIFSSNIIGYLHVVAIACKWYNCHLINDTMETIRVHNYPTNLLHARVKNSFHSSVHLLYNFAPLETLRVLPL